MYILITVNQFNYLVVLITIFICCKLPNNIGN